MVCQHDFELCTERQKTPMPYIVALHCCEQLLTQDAESVACSCLTLGYVSCHLPVSQILDGKPANDEGCICQHVFEIFPETFKAS